MKNSDIKKIENLKSGGDTYIIRWEMTRLCNYYCDFCIQGNKEKHIKDSIGENAEIRKEICNKLIKFIEEKLNGKYSNLQIYLIGGEVTILEDFITILEKLANCKFDGEIKIYVLTNLSANKNTLKQIKRIFTNRNNRILRLSTTYYKEYTTEKEFINKIKYLYKGNRIKNFLLLKRKNSTGKKKNFYIKLCKIIMEIYKKNINISINIKYPLVCDDDYEKFLKFKAKYTKYMKYTSAINYVVIRDYKSKISDSIVSKLPLDREKRIKVTLKNGKVKYFYNTSNMSMSIQNGKFNPNGFVCDSGVANLSISNLGLVFRCPSCLTKTVVGNVLEDDIELLNDKIVCPSDVCHCDYYHLIENTKI